MMTTGFSADKASQRTMNQVPQRLKGKTEASAQNPYLVKSKDIFHLTRLREFLARGPTLQKNKTLHEVLQAQGNDTRWKLSSTQRNRLRKG